MLTYIDERNPLLLGGLLGAGVTFGFLLIIVPPPLLSFFLGACFLSGLVLFCLLKPSVLIYFISLVSAAASLMRNLGKLDAGSPEITVSGVQWLFVAGICLLTIGFNLRQIQLPSSFYPFFLFVLYTVIRWATSSSNLVGI